MLGTCALSAETIEKILTSMGYWICPNYTSPPALLFLFRSVLFFNFLCILKISYLGFPFFWLSLVLANEQSLLNLANEKLPLGLTNGKFPLGLINKKLPLHSNNEMLSLPLIQTFHLNLVGKALCLANKMTAH